jgi:hypothetical protein
MLHSDHQADLVDEETCQAVAAYEDRLNPSEAHVCDLVMADHRQARATRAGPGGHRLDPATAGAR